MKKTVLTFGAISGVIVSLIMLMTVPFHDQIGFDNGYIVGYASMLAAFLLIYFGVRSYRDNVAGGSVKFGRAFVVGALIAEGLSNREISERLYVSENTVKTHSANLFTKLNARRRTQAVQIAKEAGVIP